MRIYNRYILTVAICLLLTTVVLAALGIDSLAIYYNCYAIEVLIVTELYAHLNLQARRSLNTISIVFFAGILIILALEVLKRR